jgi:poly(A) polymerase
MAERSAKQLGLSKADLPNSIIEVIATLTKSGYEAYIVGGGVRDNLLGLDPKDFDAVTDAKPHEVKDLFGKRCRVIGRRFQLAHVYSGRDMIEVATFRAPPNGDAHTTNDGMIVRDNVWGDIEQDFVRRDFSINALYYEPLKGIVHDFCDALGDIESKTLRLLGNAPVRIEEDPVRLLRALRFKAKLGFEFDDELSEQFHDDNWSLLDQVSPHRLYDESQKMFTGGYLVPLLPLLFEYGAIRHLIIYPPKAPTALVTQVAVNTDKRIGQGKSINPAFFYAALLWDNYLYQLAKLKKKGMPFHDAQLQSASIVIDRQRIKTAIPKFAEQFIRDIWLMQPKLANPRVKQITQLAEHPRFRAAFDFLLLREQCDDESNPLSESTNGMGEWWQTYQTLSEKQKQQALDDFGGDARRGSSKRSRGRNRNRNRDDDYRDDSADKSDESNHVSTTADDHKTKSSRQSDHERRPMRARQPKSPDTATKPSQSSQFAQERAQLQRLSLGELAGEAQDTQLAKPLFTIDAAKMAKQVPLQKKAEEAAAKAQNQQRVSEKMPAVAKSTEQADKALKHNAQSEAKAKPTAQAKPAAEKTRRTGQGNSEAVLLPKVETVPSKRRRRLPSSEVTQVERAKQAAATSKVSESGVSKSAVSESALTSNSNDKAQPVTKNKAPAAKKAAAKKPVQTNAQASTQSAQTNAKAQNAAIDAAQAQQNEANDQAKSNSSRKAAAKTKAKAEDKAPAKKSAKPTTRKSNKAAVPATAEQIATGVVKNSERVPATRRRRAPTSEQTVKERLATDS